MIRWLLALALLSLLAVLIWRVLAFGAKPEPLLWEQKKTSRMFDGLGVRGYQRTQPTQPVQHKPVLRYRRQG